MAWDMNNWVQTRINAHQTKVWVWKPNTISKIEKWDGSQPDNTWVSRARKSDDISDMYGRWTA